MDQVYSGCTLTWVLALSFTWANGVLVNMAQAVLKFLCRAELTVNHLPLTERRVCNDYPVDPRRM